ncbi:hypothetical protein SLEP1_g53355 [Rubroshorea leprosula]|uniref:Uncharacterized protein n=1 Tax=Rubroshorea leprosula TaxID=152421 RepID=A0AAV5M9D0_9ROSI|nr:hypothetical protein SLEP1_g53355 [Rubroshorea leprosula]
MNESAPVVAAVAPSPPPPPKSSPEKTTPFTNVSFGKSSELIISKGMNGWPWHRGNSQPPMSLQNDVLRQANQFEF